MADIFELLKKLSLSSSKPQTPPEYLIVGLGNPGDKYTFTRHNAGFLAVDYIAEKLKVKITNLKFKSLYAQASMGNHSVILVKPQTYMNLSGEAVHLIADYYHIEPEKIIVLVDDIYQDAGKMRIRSNGSAGGHNGLKNINALIGSENYPRVKIGVGKKPSPEYDLATFVTSRFPKTDEEKLFKIFGCVYEAVLLMLDGKTDEAMCKFNGVSF